MNTCVAILRLRSAVLLALLLTLRGEAAAGPAPRIVCDQPTLSFGQAPSGSTVERVFTLRNEGTLSLVIERVASSCGCTAGLLKSNTIAPGESTEVAVKLNLKNRRGPQRQTVTVHSNDPRNPALALLIHGEAVEQIEVSPPLCAFPVLGVNEAPSREVVIRSLQEKLDLVKVETSPASVAAEVTSEADGRTLKVLVSIRPPLPPGRINGTVTVHTTHPTHPVVEIPVVGSVAGDLAYVPDTLLLGPASGALPATRFIMVRPARVSQFSIQKVETPFDTMRVKIDPLSNRQGYRIQIANIRPGPELEGKVVRIHTDAPGMPLIEIPFAFAP